MLCPPDEGGPTDGNQAPVPIRTAVPGEPDAQAHYSNAALGMLGLAAALIDGSTDAAAEFAGRGGDLVGDGRPAAGGVDDAGRVC